ncbi:MAG: hypothetical protein Q8P68_04035 [Candidatus Peregrinibacteria bacterium]|nr:hypothetical protein [Candidatus Peregrinibacteria bacterium]MDZ4245296.1 hypothetical protein [Candidatus Gracilibacteria bacterium]
MNDTAMHAGTHQDPFTAIQDTEGQAEKSIEKEMHRNTEAMAEARLAREDDLKVYENELKNEGMQKLKETKEAAMNKMEAELKEARTSSELLKSNAKNKMPEAIKLIIDKLNISVTK